jgi:hypothetical protein
MKKILLLIFICCFFHKDVFSQSLTSMIPDTGYTGLSLTTTITSSGLFIQSSSPSGNIYRMYLNHSSTYIELFEYNSSWNYNVNILDADHATVSFTVPYTAPQGSYDLWLIAGDSANPTANQQTYSLSSAFNVIDTSSQHLISIDPDSGLVGQTNLMTTITAAGMFIQSSSPSGNVYRMYLEHGTQTIDLFKWESGWLYDLMVTDADHTQVSVNIPSSAAQGTYDLYVITGDVAHPPSNQHTYSLPNAFSVTDTSAQKLISMAPDTGFPGQMALTTTITSAGLFIQSSSPSGNIYRIYLNHGGYNIDLFTYYNSWNYNVMIMDADHTQVSFNIPLSALQGKYELFLVTGDVGNPLLNQHSYSLPDAFTVTTDTMAANGNFRSALVFPNPSENSATLAYKNPNNETFTFILMNIRGNIMLRITDNSTQVTLQRNSLPSGIYFYELTNVDHSLTYRGKIVFR